MQSDNLKYWIAFNRIRGIGRVRFKLLESSFDSIQSAWNASEAELRAAGLDARTIRAIVNGRQSVDPEAELEALKRSGVRALTWHDADYPPRLKQIYDLPPLLYVKGALLPDDERSIAVVGTRKPSPYGVQVAEKMVRDIAEAGVAVVSGLARGVDGIAHNAALNAGARTIAVLGSGVDVIYPREHQRLAARIAENGALVSEHPLGTRPDARNFPRRNRIMSGMTLGTLVIEAPENSGALITAKQALDENREVFAVPGNIFSPSSAGVNRLIRESAAKLVTNCAEVLEELNLTAVSRQIQMAALFPEDETEAELLRYITYDPVHIDDVCRSSGKATAHVSSALAMMELKGLVKQVGGMNYIRLRETSAEYSAAPL